MNKIFKVIKVINNMKIVINGGISDELKSSMRFLVYENGEDLIDPDTGDNLGSLEIIKGKAKINHIQDRITTLEPIEINIPSRRIIRKTGIMLGFGQVEETGDEWEQKPFENVKEGDLVKIISA
jgi:hypothetical protein